MFKQSILSLCLCSFVVTATPQQSLKMSTPLARTWYGSFLIQNLTGPIVDAVMQRITGHTPMTYYYNRFIHIQPRFIFENDKIKKSLKAINTKFKELERKIQSLEKSTENSASIVRLGPKDAQLKKDIEDIKEKIESEKEEIDKIFYQFYRSKRWLMLKMNAFQLTQSYASTLAMNFAFQLGSRESTPFAQQLARALMAQALPVIMSALSAAFGATYRNPVALLSAKSNYVNKLFEMYKNKEKRQLALDSLKILLAEAYGVKAPTVPLFPNPFSTIKHVYIVGKMQEEEETILFQYRFDVLPSKARESAQ